jgi:hypothetical protein
MRLGTDVLGLQQSAAENQQEKKRINSFNAGNGGPRPHIQALVSDGFGLSA